MAVEHSGHQPESRRVEGGRALLSGSALTLTGQTYTGAGVIERIADVDAFSFNVAAPLR